MKLGILPSVRTLFRMQCEPAGAGSRNNSSGSNWPNGAAQPKPCPIWGCLKVRRQSSD